MPGDRLLYAMWAAGVGLTGYGHWYGAGAGYTAAGLALLMLTSISA